MNLLDMLALQIHKCEAFESIIKKIFVWGHNILGTGVYVYRKIDTI